METPKYEGAALRLSEWREKAGLSQTELATRIIPAVTQAAVCRWETGDSRPDLTKALQLQGLSEGAVLATLWGYSDEETRAVARAFLPAVDPNEIADRATGTEG